MLRSKKDTSFRVSLQLLLIASLAATQFFGEVTLEAIELKQDFPGYNKAKVPADFTRLLGVGEERYCRYVWSKKISKKQPAWQAIGYRQSGKTVTSLLDFKLKAEGFIPAIERRHCGVDVFISPNEFFDWRNTKQLAQLHANWLEIDTVGHGILSLDQQKAIFSEVHQIIKDKALPAPTGFVASGSGGIHLYWIYEGVPAFKWRVRVWREITLVLAKTLKKSRAPDSLWEVDFAASRDPSRVLRLPGTYHGKSGRIVDSYVGGPRYTFDELAKGLIRSEKNIKALLSTERSEKATWEPKRTKTNTSVGPPPSNPTSLSGKHTIGQWWFRIYSVVCTHARVHGVKEGKRDLYGFILYVALRHIKASPEDALQAIQSLNKEFIGLDDSELTAYLKTAISTNYKYTKNTLAEFLEANLGISSAFLYENDKPRLTPSQIKERQQDSAERTAKTRKERTLNLIKNTILQLKKANKKATQKVIAEKASISIRTVKRYWSEVASVRGTLAPPLYIPAPQGLAPLVKPCPRLILEQQESKDNDLNIIEEKHVCNGAVGAKSLFSQICSILASIPKVEGVVCPFSYLFRGRMARVVLSYNMSETDSIFLAISVASAAADPEKAYFSQDDWMGYLVRALQNSFEAKLLVFEPLIGKFLDLLAGKDAYLTDYQWVLFKEYREIFGLNELTSNLTV